MTQAPGTGSWLRLRLGAHHQGATSHMQRSIAVLGAGAIGSSIGADLTQAGYDVTIIDQWPAQIEALRTSGLRIEMTDGDVEVAVRALHLCDLAAANQSFDIVFLAVKSNDHRWL